MEILITGCFGQDGIILSEILKKRGHEVIGSFHPEFDIPTSHPFLTTNQLVPLDVANSDGVEEVISSRDFKAVVHLAGETSVASSWENPARTFNTNILGTTNLISALQAQIPKALFINAVSVEVFDTETEDVNETSPMRASNPYGLSKLATAQFVEIMRDRGFKGTNVFLSNHESKYRPEKFVTGKLARGVAAIADGRADSLSMGDLSVIRDWSSAFDICDGILRIVEREFTGDVILASGKNHKLSEIVEQAFISVGISDWQKHVASDLSLTRTNDHREIKLNVLKSQTELGWSATTAMSDWISEMVSAFRQ